MKIMKRPVRKDQLQNSGCSASMFGKQEGNSFSPGIGTRLPLHLLQWPCPTPASVPARSLAGGGAWGVAKNMRTLQVHGGGLMGPGLILEAYMNCCSSCGYSVIPGGLGQMKRWNSTPRCWKWSDDCICMKQCACEGVLYPFQLEILSPTMNEPEVIPSPDHRYPQNPPNNT